MDEAYNAALAAYEEAKRVWKATAKRLLAARREHDAAEAAYKTALLFYSERAGKWEGEVRRMESEGKRVIEDF